MEYSSMKYRYFFMSFSIAFLILTVMFLFLMSAVHPQTPASLLEEPGVEGASGYVPSAEDAITVLFVGYSGEGGAEAGTFLLARFDPVGGQVPIVVFPGETAVDNNGKWEPISQVYRYGGADYTRNVLAGTLGIPIDRYVKISESAFVTAAAAVGTVEFQLPREMTVGTGELPVTLGQGIQLLDGQRVAEIMGYGGEGELERCALAGELAAAIVNQRMDIALSTVVDNVFARIINLIDTDISYLDYEDRKDAGEFMARLGQDPAAALPVSGAYDDSGLLYHLSDTFLVRLGQLFG